MSVKSPPGIPFSSNVPFAETSAVIDVPATWTVTLSFFAAATGEPDEAVNAAPSPSTTPCTTTPPLAEGDEGLSPPQAPATTAATTAAHVNRARRFMTTSCKIDLQGVTRRPA